MEIGERLKLLRKSIGLSQKELASKICVVQAHVSAMEKGIRDITDRTISDICRETGVSEEWLRTGTGEMFVSNQIPASAFSELAQEYNLDAVDIALISEYMKLDVKYRSALKNKIREIFLADDEEISIRREVSEYEAELRAEKGEKSSASGTTSAKEA